MTDPEEREKEIGGAVRHNTLHLLEDINIKLRLRKFPDCAGSFTLWT